MFFKCKIIRFHFELITIRTVLPRWCSLPDTNSTCNYVIPRRMCDRQRYKSLVSDRSQRLLSISLDPRRMVLKIERQRRIVWLTFLSKGNEIRIQWHRIKSKFSNRACRKWQIYVYRTWELAYLGTTMCKIWLFLINRLPHSPLVRVT